jgi:D-lactate dehydrogenase (cytochrome)
MRLPRRFLPALAFGVTGGLVGSAVPLQQHIHESHCSEAWRQQKPSSVSNIVGASSADNMRSLVQDLRDCLSPDQVDTNKDECEQRGKPWNSYHSSNTHPDAIVQPESTEQVSAIMKLCARYSVPVVPYGGGTSLEGQLLAPAGGISIDFSRMKRVIALREEDLDCTVQAGLGYIELNEILRPLGLWFPLDPGPGASVGGMIATRCSGSTAVRYGSMRENVLNITAVLPDGTILTTGGRARKSSAGYDLTRLLVGSEGTLAVATEVTLKLHPLPTHSYAIRVAFPSVEAAAHCASNTLRAGLSVGRCELIDEVMVRDINSANPQLHGGAWSEEVTLLYELTGPSRHSVEEQTAALRGLAQAAGATGLIVCDDPEDTAQLWKTRKECLWSAMSQHPGKDPMITDVCVPLSRLSELISTTRKDLDASPLHCPIIAHAGDGNFHVLIMFDPKIPEERLEAQRLADLMARRAISMGGTCTGEHGVGVGKRHLLTDELGENSIKLMRHIKLAVDPKGIMNPGKVLPDE